MALAGLLIVEFQRIINLDFQMIRGAESMAGGENICFRARKRNFSETGRFEDDPASKRRGGRSGGASMGFGI